MAQLGGMRWGIGVLVGLVAALQAAPAGAASGLVSLEASAKLTAKGCGKFAGTASVELALAADGTWRMSIEDDELAGTYTAGGKGDRTLTLSPDAASLATIQTGLRNLAGSVCDVPVDAAVVTPKTLRAKLNKAATSASVLLKASLAGDGNPLKKGKYTLSGNGVLGPLPTTTTSTVTTTTTIQVTTSSTATTTSSSTNTSSTLTSTTVTSLTSTSILISTSTTTSSTSSSTSTSTLTSTSTTTTTLPFAGYGDCVNNGPEACLPTESCISGLFEGSYIGLCTSGCTSDEDCPSAATGSAPPFCDVANTDSCLLRCDGGEDCPLGMTCVGSTLCVYTAPCTPNCAEAICGDDGCGGSCGECAPGTACESGQCVVGSCVGRCGTFDSEAPCQCDALCVGEGDCCLDRCDPGVCDMDPVCQCTPDCSERACGSDGCGGSCGECLDPGTVCSEAGQCLAADSCAGRCDIFSEATNCQCDGGCYGRGDCCADLCNAGVCDMQFVCTCVPDCTERACGSDGCFGSCGSCGMPGEVCSVAGQCVAGNSCVGRCGGGDAGASCQCDSECPFFEDCCPDLCDVGVCENLPQCMAPPG